MLLRPQTVFERCLTPAYILERSDARHNGGRLAFGQY
jgi:hypothetical protein